MILMATPVSDAASHLVALLERHRETFPPLDEELAQQRSLRQLLCEHRTRGEQALSAWRAAISRRWECEVNAQRAYTAVQRQLGEYYLCDAAYAQLIAPAHPGSASTPTDLLHEVRRLEASLELLSPPPPFAAAASDRLRAAGVELALAIEQTLRCETERRSVLTEQRIARNLYERAYDRARRQLARFLGEHAVGLPLSYPDVDEP
jgi:hypothetical protein